MVEAVRSRWIACVSVVLLAALIGCQERGESDIDAVVEQARVLVTERKFSEALDLMRGLVDEHPDDARVQSLYGEALLASGQPSLAVWPLARAVKDPEQLIYAGLLLARAQGESGSGADAIKTATQILEAHPDNAAALQLRIQAYLGESMETKALEDLDRLEELGGEKSDLDLLRLDALLGLGREQEAEALLKEISAEADAMREDEPAKAARLCAATATFSAERGDFAGAKARFQECLEGDGIHHGVLVQAAVKFFDEHGESDLATDIYRRRFEEDPDEIGERVPYADRLQAVGRFAAGEKLLLEATAEDASAWAALADLYAVKGDVQKALAALEKAIAASPKQREDWAFSRADFQLALGDVEAAARTAETLKVPAHRELVAARIALEQGELDESIRHFEEGIRLWPDNPDARYLAGHAYERRGDWGKAAAHYREAARMEEPHYESSLALAELQRALGDSEGVSFLLLRLADARPNDAKVVEKLIEFAGDTGAEDLGRSMLTHLARIRGQAGRAVALAAGRAELAQGAEEALQVIDATKLDVLDPRHVEALEARTRLLIKLERRAEALAAVEKAMSRSADSPRLFVLRATIHVAASESDLAEADLERALTLDSEYLPALLDLARLHEANGRVDRAREIYARAVPIERAKTPRYVPGDQSAAIALARLEISTGAVDAARARLRESLATNPRQGEAAWLLLKTYSDVADSGDLDAKTRLDLALRAALFERSPEAQDYYKKLIPKKS